MDHSEHSFPEHSSQGGTDPVADPFPSDLADATPEQLAAIHAILDLAAASTSANASSSTGTNSGSDHQHASLLPDPSQLAMPLSPSITSLFAHQQLQQHGQLHNEHQLPVGHDFLLQSTSRLAQQARTNPSSREHRHALSPPHVLEPGPLSPSGQLTVSVTRPLTAESSSSAPGLAELGTQGGPASSSASFAHLQNLLLNSPISPALAFPANPFGYAPFLDHEQTAAAVLAMATAMNQDVQQQHGRNHVSVQNHSAPDSPMPSESSLHDPQPALSEKTSAAVALLHAHAGSLTSPVFPQLSSSAPHSTTASHFPVQPLAPLAPPAIPYFAAFPPRVPLVVDESRYRSTPLLDPLYATVEKLAEKSNIPGFKHADRIAASEVVAAHRDEMRLLCESVESACLNDPKLQELTAVGAYNEFNDDVDQPDTTLFELMHKRFVLRPAAVLDFNDYMVQFQQHLSAPEWDTSPLVLQALGIRTPAAREQLSKAQQLYVEFAADMSRSLQEQYEARRDLVLRTQAAIPMFSCAHSRSWAPPIPHVRNLDVYYAQTWNRTESKLAATFILWLQEIKSQQKPEDMEPDVPLNDEQLKDVPLSSLVELRSSRKHAFDTTVLSALRASYAHEKYPTEEERQRLARLCNLSAHQVSVWFMNRRQRGRAKEKKRRRQEESPEIDESAASSPGVPAPLSPTRAPTASVALQKLLSSYYSTQPTSQPPMPAASLIASSSSSTQVLEGQSAPFAPTAVSATSTQAKRRASASAVSPSVSRPSQRRRAASREPSSPGPPPSSTTTAPPTGLDSTSTQPPFSYPLGPPIIPPQLPGFPFPFGLPAPFQLFPSVPHLLPYHSSVAHFTTPHGQLDPPPLSAGPHPYPPTIPYPPVSIPSMIDPPPLSQPNQSQDPQRPPPPSSHTVPDPTHAPPPAFNNPFHPVPQPHPSIALAPMGPLDQATATFFQQQQQYAYLLSMAALGPFGLDTATSAGGVPHTMSSNEGPVSQGTAAQEPSRDGGRPQQSSAKDELLQD